ncbi:hypothetical protein LLG46_04225 [bacterium]|nr:hypothetical protein [bacterium]
MPLRRWIKYLSAVIFLFGIAALLYVKLNISPRQSLFADFVPSADGKIWSVIGSTDSPKEAYVGMDGSLQSGRTDYAIYWYLYDRNSHSLLKPKHIRRSLLDGHLPCPIVEWTEKGINTKITSFVDAEDICFSAITIKNTTRQDRSLNVFMAALPYGVTGRMQSAKSIEYNSRENALEIDSQRIYCDSRPKGFGAVISSQQDNRLIDITGYIANGALPRYGSHKTHRKSQVISGAIGYEITLKPGSARTFTFKTPVSNRFGSAGETSSHWDKAMQSFRKEWGKQLYHVKLSLPDKRYADCFYASLAYLMILSDDGAPRPGSAIYGPFWVRDNAYIVDAYYFAGRQDLAAQSLEQLYKMQLPNGGFRPHTGTGGDSEYDAPGQAIYTLVGHYRRTGDIDSLRRAWPAIKSAARYINGLRMDRDGILPPSMSAEDLGSEKQQHYWDDFWAVRGLLDASYAAETLGYYDDAKQIGKAAQSLMDATWTSIRKSAKQHSLDYIPNGPQDLTSSAMARGTSCGIWPTGVLEPSDPFVRSSFDIYWKKWIGPHNGGFEHKGEFWPYAGMDMAMDYLILGEYGRSASILRWSINHDPTKGFYSWPEGMNMKNLTLAAGDMPHGWMCASYISLIRNMLVRESVDGILIASGVPQEWLEPGRQIKIADFPVSDGRVTYSLSASKNAIDIDLDCTTKVKTCRMILPKSIKVTALVVDGHRISSFSANECAFLASAHRITIKINNKSQNL